MLLRYIIWLILIFIAAKIVGSIIIYIRKLLTPNQHIKDRGQDKKVGEYKNVEEIPYEDVSQKE